jgi:tRNA N6-adenosine threonylcarbamoyltransferase
MPLKSDIKILAIESSCDDTAASVIVNGKICSNIVAGQSVHEQYGGVVPELASRAHQQHIIPVVQSALKKAQVSLDDLSAIAFTQGPGLLGSLMVGSSFSKAIALSKKIPLIGVNHLEAHVLAPFIEFDSIPFPYLCLLVSGGHTQIVQVNSSNDMVILGKTLDDAAGEAFDKSAKMMGLPYPGGPQVDLHGLKGNPKRFAFPDSRVGDLDFSFSGFKTAVLYFLRDEKEKNPDFLEQNLNDLCASIQHTIVSYLMRKLVKASDETGIKEIAISGGVSANSSLRNALITKGAELNWNTYIPSLEYCTDNAGMVAMAAHFHFKQQQFVDQSTVPYARIK